VRTLRFGPRLIDCKTTASTTPGDIKEPGGAFKQDSVGGWAGLTDKYWLAAVAPDQKMAITARFVHRLADSADRFQVDYLGTQVVTIPPGASVEVVDHLFVGAKESNLLDAYSDRLGIPKFDLAIDFGWFYFLTKPFFIALQFLHGLLGNFGLAILALTVVVKLLFFPLANKSYRAMSKMKKLQPEMKKLQERFADDKVRLNQELVALYKREKANPASGCLPILVQIPVFFALYKVLFVTIEMRQAPFYGWIHDLSAPDPTTLFNLFGLIPWTPPAFLMIGVWPLVMGITMYLQQKLNPQPADPVQAKMFLFLPLIFTFMLASFPAGLVIYWAWNNALSIGQQWVIMRGMGVKA
ncbi:MAG: membrane protein insertase YidC, partial [Alphaproteobacteria bacterium]